MLADHHLLDAADLMVFGINEDEILSARNFFVETGNFLVFIGYAGQTAYPGTKAGNRSSRK